MRRHNGDAEGDGVAAPDGAGTEAAVGTEAAGADRGLASVSRLALSVARSWRVRSSPRDPPGTWLIQATPSHSTVPTATGPPSPSLIHMVALSATPGGRSRFAPVTHRRPRRRPVMWGHRR